MMSYLGSWQFWVAVVLVTFISHWAINLVMAKVGGTG